MRVFTILMAIALMLGVAPILLAANLWQDDFGDGAMNSAYLIPDRGNGVGPPQWSETGGVLKQTEPRSGDPTYCAIDLGQDINFCGQLVRIRFDEWEDHDRSRAGVGFWLDPADNYNGYTTLIHNSLTVGNYQFLNDGRGWHNPANDLDTGGVGAWFWMRAEIDFDTKQMVGKVWVGDLSDEPAGWMIESNPTTWVGLNGGTGTDAEGGHSKISFDEWTVYDGSGEVAVEPQAKLTTTWGALKW